MLHGVTRLTKLRGRSFGELGLRSWQMLSAAAERRGVSAEMRIPVGQSLYRRMNPAVVGHHPLTAEWLHDHFRARSSPHFFSGCAEPTATVLEWQRRWPERARATIEWANRITESRFDLLGYRDLSFGDPIDWHLDPVSGKRAPQAHWSRVDPLDADQIGDHKIIWELNRHQYFVTLGRAYWVTGNECFAHTFVSHLLAWMEANPPKYGINWASSLEVAFRAVAWLWALQFFRCSAELTAPVLECMLGMLYLHGRHVETYLSTYFSPNTHLTGEALGLFYLGVLLPEFRRSARWLRLGRRILLDQIVRQVRADGVHFEQSSHYHRYSTDFYLHLLILMRLNAMPVDSALEAGLTALLDHMMYVTKPDGTTPLIGDDDGGQWFATDHCSPGDCRAALSTGAALFSRSDYKYVAGEPAEETLWLLGSEGVRRFEALAAQPPEQMSRGFADSGVYVMRDGWTDKANYLLVDAGPHGALSGGHAHADALSFELAATGRTLLIDPGTYTYAGSRKMRDLFRSTGMHNALTVDGHSSSVPEGPFSWRQTAHASARTWICGDRFDYFEGQHDGYLCLDSPVLHSRSILFLKGDYWILRDRVTTTGVHRCELHFHYVPGAEPSVRSEGGAIVISEQWDAANRLEVFSLLDDGEWRRDEGLVSRCYGDFTAAPVVTLSWQVRDPRTLVTFLMPCSHQDPRAAVRPIDASNGQAVEIRRGDSVDRLLASDGQHVAAGPYGSDFDLAWIRLGPDATLAELLLIGGRRFGIDGAAVVDAEERIGYVSARRHGERVLLQTDATPEVVERLHLWLANGSQSPGGMS